MATIDAGMLAHDLTELRDGVKRDRKDCVVNTLHNIGYENNTSVSIAQFDAFLIRAVSERFDITVDRDIVLMAFGLLVGYSYTEMGISERRKKYLIESNYQKTRSRPQQPYNEANDKEKYALRERLRKAEDERIVDLANFLAKKDIENYIKNNVGDISLPVPSYVREKHRTIRQQYRPQYTYRRVM